MKPKPQPKKELAIGFSSKVSRLIQMSTASEDAFSFACKAAAEYGQFYSHENRISLTVDDNFDYDEVLAYFESYNE